MNDDDMDELAGITCARCGKVAPITADELRQSDDPAAPALSLPVVLPTPAGWYDELESGEPPVVPGWRFDPEVDGAAYETTGRIVCGDCATSWERAAQALGEAAVDRATRAVAREEGVLPEEEEEGPRDPDDEDDDDPVPA